MTVRELLKTLEGVDPDREIVVSIDAHGSGYRTFDTSDPDGLVWNGETHPTNYDDPSWWRSREEFETAMAEGEPTVILYPFE